VPYRLLRFTFSLRAPEEGRVEEVRYAMRLLPSDDDHPRVHSIYPERLEVDRETTTEMALEPSLSIGSAVDVGLGRLGRTIVARQPALRPSASGASMGRSGRCGRRRSARGSRDHGSSLSSFGGHATSAHCGSRLRSRPRSRRGAPCFRGARDASSGVMSLSSSAAACRLPDACGRFAEPTRGARLPGCGMPANTTTVAACERSTSRSADATSEVFCSKFPPAASSRTRRAA